MAITNTVPKVAIYQDFLAVTSGLTNAQQACIVGPQFGLLRYDNATEKPLGALGALDYDTETAYSYPNKALYPGVVDQDFVRVFVDAAVLQYLYDDTSTITAKSGWSNKITCSTLNFKTANGYARSGVFNNRDVAVGDVVTVSHDGTSHTTTVSGFEYASVAATVGSAEAGEDNAETQLASSSATSGTLTGITPTTTHTAFAPLPFGQISETYTFVCTSPMIGTSSPASAVFTITSASGKDNVVGWSPAAFGASKSFGSQGAAITLTDTSGGSDPAIALGATFTAEYNVAFTEPTVTITGTYTGVYDTTYIVRCLGATATKAILQVSTTTGVDASPATLVALNTPTAMGSNGLSVAINAIPCALDQWEVDVTAAHAGACNTLILRNSMPTALVSGTPTLTLSLGIKKNVELDSSAFTTSSTSITVLADPEATDSSWTVGGAITALPVIAGNLFVQYRVCKTLYTQSMSSITNSLDVASILGPTVVENPLALGVYAALENSSGVTVNFIAVASDDLEGYVAALDKIRNEANVFSVVPLTQDPEIQQAVVAHVNSCSDPENNRRRICWLNSESPSTVKIAPTSGTLFATISDDPEVGTNYVIVHSDGADFTDTVLPGDLLLVGFTSEGASASYVIDQVMGDTLRLASGPAAGESTPVKIEIWRSLTDEAIATAYAAKSAAFGNRRVRHIFPATVEIGGDSVPGYYACAMQAGYKSAAAPHQPLSRTVLNGLTGAAASLQLSEACKDILAEGGTWILTQDTVGGPVYTRLDLTTDTTDVNKWQDARTSNCDSVSSAFFSILDRYVGRANISRALLTQIRADLLAQARELSISRSTTLGPQLKSFEFVSDPVQSATLADTVEIEVALGLPYELTRVNLKLYVS